MVVAIASQVEDLAEAPDVVNVHHSHGAAVAYTSPHLVPLKIHPRRGHVPRPGTLFQGRGTPNPSWRLAGQRERPAALD